VVGFVHHDRTREELSAQLQQAERLASVGLLAGSAAHEIKNDLGPLLGCLSLMDDRGDDMIPLMQESARRIHAHVEQILAPLRPRVRTRGAVVVRGTIDGILEVLRRAGRLRRITIDLVEDADVIVFADRDELYQVASNLLVNAIDSLGDRDGGERGRIQIRLAIDQEFGLLEVADDGAGIPENMRRRVFEPFFTTKGQAGTGLGLPVVHDIVRGLQGHITLRSVEGVGTTVSVRLPLFRGST
jgi:signal transduction histidine kinase